MTSTAKDVGSDGGGHGLQMRRNQQKRRNGDGNGAGDSRAVRVTQIRRDMEKEGGRGIEKDVEGEIGIET